ncbi:hypothetical protein [Pelagibacterium xiamenense]|uniref:hypothetical protein n=1 Tax=Pelagibacterium xiamenense TaxID=2901140 RepID=UPI001E52BA80|nr:hypothetical protein [Pelagibacterium xiamenense]MCD7058418.1 hypothetical protein [Pelagibacterium xiamenense]
MWSPSRAARAAAVAIAVLAAPVLAACSFGPVYSGAAQSRPALALRYAEPGSRLEQIVYQELARDLGRSTDADAPVLSVSVGISETRVGLSSASSPVSDRQVVATATWTLREDGAVISTGKRTAVSGYQRTGQTFADDRAEANAEEQATRAVAEAVRLALLAELAPQ